MPEEGEGVLFSVRFCLPSLKKSCFVFLYFLHRVDWIWIGSMDQHIWNGGWIDECTWMGILPFRVRFVFFIGGGEGKFVRYVLERRKNVTCCFFFFSRLVLVLCALFSSATLTERCLIWIVERNLGFQCWKDA